MTLYGEITEYNLKTCPFCGKAVKMKYYCTDYPFTFTDNGYEIKCERCKYGFTRSISKLPEFAQEDAKQAQERLAEFWNTRKGK